MSKLDRRIVAIIQARMGSTRLPGKALMDIEGRPMLWHIVNRLRHSKLIDAVVVATGSDKRDDAIEEFCSENDVDFHRGDAGDVLDRYYHSAVEYHADVVVRITADCPLTDPCVSDRVISSYLANENAFDAASNTVNRRYPRGLDVEVVPFSVLEWIWREAQDDYQREHVTIYIYEHPEKLRVYSVENDKDLSSLRWTVDEEADLIFVREIYKRLYKNGKIFLMEDILQLLKEEPDLEKINQHVRQKAISK